MVFPKGKRASRISLKCCLPKGMPMIVILNTTPQKRCVKAMANLPRNHQITFMMPAKQPDGKLVLPIRVPNGHRATCASLMVCTPKGMPMMVIIRTKLERIYSIEIISPPNITQTMLSSVFMVAKLRIMTVFTKRKQFSEIPLNFVEMALFGSFQLLNRVKNGCFNS